MLALPDSTGYAVFKAIERNRSMFFTFFGRDA